jgi:nickel-dependent lactate racemase
VHKELVFGSGWIPAELPDDAFLVPPGVSVPLAPAPDLAQAVDDALDRPLDTPPLRELARGARRVTVAFDDPTVLCYAPVWSVAIPRILGALGEAGVPGDRVTLACANGLHRKFTNDELASILGEQVVAEFAPDGRLVCNDAEDAEGMVHLGDLEDGAEVEVNRLVTDSDLTVYLNASTVRGFSGGWKSVCVGLSSYRSIRWHHTPDTMSMTTEKNRMHETLDRMGAVVEGALGADRFFKIDTILSNPLQVHRLVGGSVGATRREVLEVMRASQPPRRNLLPEKVDVVLYGVPDWSPYAAFSFLNPLLTLLSTGLGYLGGMVEALGKPGCTVIMATPVADRWDEVHHPSYREVWERVLPETRDPFVVRERFEPEFAARADYVDRYRWGFGFHPVHAIMALYPLKRLRHAGRVLVAGAEDPELVRHAGFEPASSVEEALRMAAETHGNHPSVAVVENPPAFNRT